MNTTMNLWLLGMGIPPEKIEDDIRLLDEINAQEGLGAWQRLQTLRYQKGLRPYPEFDTPNAQLEFMSIVSGNPQLYM